MCQKGRSLGRLALGLTLDLFFRTPNTERRAPNASFVRCLHQRRSGLESLGRPACCGGVHRPVCGATTRRCVTFPPLSESKGLRLNDLTTLYPVYIPCI